MDDFGGVEDRLLTDDEKSEFRDFEEMFNTAGWAKLKKEILEEVETAPLRLFWDVKSFDELQNERNRLGNLLRIVHMEDAMLQRREGLVRERLSFLEEAQEGYSAGE